jgi:hypothetical protein
LSALSRMRKVEARGDRLLYFGIPGLFLLAKADFRRLQSCLDSDSFPFL